MLHLCIFGDGSLYLAATALGVSPSHERLGIAERLVQSGRRPNKLCGCVYAAPYNPALPCMAGRSQVRHDSLPSI